MHKRFEINDIGEAKLWVGLRITLDRENGVADRKPISTPADANHTFTKDMSPKSSSERER